MVWGQGARMALPIYGYYMQKIYNNPKIKITTKDFKAPIDFDQSKYYCDDPDNNTNEQIIF